jgi:hypothetical protein
VVRELRIDDAVPFADGPEDAQQLGYGIEEAPASEELAWPDTCVAIFCDPSYL